ncbi:MULTISPECIES: helix-turn-helix transcriptional regulator [Leptolyngbya]|uniref:helix-turn-helix transcriptional regulator n=1 Tax=Leptolyngbya TaxID=47251 RepID=UPI0016844395|nr:helix-turn-helix transcriptional regulator [Leptolyngbya sp. FACHB-1624]MBD1856191.1 helix-turn-helix transcriptional regulator [Leptolyngbya sp. FACHB-1624]
MGQAVNTTWLKDLRQEADLTQERLAVRLGVCVSTIRSWERGRVQPTMTLEQWEELAAAVNVPLNELRTRISRVA